MSDNVSWIVLLPLVVGTFLGAGFTWLFWRLRRRPGFTVARSQVAVSAGQAAVLLVAGIVYVVTGWVFVSYVAGGLVTLMSLGLWWAFRKRIAAVLREPSKDCFVSQKRV